MFGHFGFSYTGLIFLLLLLVPNLIWTKNMPEGYSSEGENKVLLIFERAGEVLVSTCAVVFTEFNWHGASAWSWWLAAAFLFMLLYEVWWIRYFRSQRKLRDFYSSLLGIPVAGATLPVLAFFLLGIYGKVLWMLIATGILGIGHIGIHLLHRAQLK